MHARIAVTCALIAFAAPAQAANDPGLDTFLNVLGPQISVILAINHEIESGTYFDGGVVVSQQKLLQMDGRQVGLRAVVCRSESQADAWFAQKCIKDQIAHADTMALIAGRDIDTARIETLLSAQVLDKQAPVDGSSPEAVVGAWTRRPPAWQAVAVRFHCRDDAACVSVRQWNGDDEAPSVYENGRWSDEAAWTHDNTFTLYCNGEPACRDVIANTTRLIVMMSGVSE
jgi:hypothetical protein